MSTISNIANHHQEATKFMAPGNLTPLYNEQAVNEVLEAGGDPVELRRQIPLMPLMEEGFGRENYIPVDDTDNVFYKFMGLLVSRSILEPNFYVVKYVPIPKDTMYPTRIGTGPGGKIRYEPITGFIAQGTTHRLSRKDIALITHDGHDEKIVELGRSQDSRTISVLVLAACQRAVLRHDNYSSNPNLKTA